MLRTKLSLFVCVLSSDSMNEANKLNRFGAFSFTFMVMYIWPANNAMPMNITSFHWIVSFIFILTIFPILSHVLAQKHDGKGWRKLIIKGFFFSKNVKLIVVNAHNAADTMCICYDNKPRQRIVWSYKIIVLFKRFELFLFSNFFYGAWIGYEYNRFESSALAWNLCSYESNQCTDQWMDLFCKKQQRHNRMGAGQGKMSQQIKWH